jgi:RNA polymerase sigma-70 factor (ECF subfamily)
LRSLLEAAASGVGLAGAVAGLTRPDVVLAGWWGSVPVARGLLAHILRSDAEDGVRVRVVEVLASARYTVMECELVSPPWHPTHCPPSVLWVVGMRDERIDRIRLYHPLPA